MKKILLISLLALLGMSQAVAQEYEYVPFVREGVKWVYYIENYHIDDIVNNPAMGDYITHRTLEFKGDTVINGKTYKAMHKYSGNAINEENDTIPMYLREEDKVVYGIIPDGKEYDDCLVDGYLLSNNIFNGQEFVLYDFQDAVTYWQNLVEGFLNQYGLTTDNHVEISLDTITVGNHLAKRYSGTFNTFNSDFEVIEGIGLIGKNCHPLGLFLPVHPAIFDLCFGLEKVVENDEVIYPQNFIEDRYLPIIREGVKWVNERVTVSDGDTTCHYYSYEFRGNHPNTNSSHYVFKAMYCNNEDTNESSETLIAGLREYDAGIICFENEALNSVIEQDRNLIDFHTTYYREPILYLMNKFSMAVYYINYEREPILNAENFFMTEPIMVDGVRCNRCVYIGENGDTLAYVVEGIGFDSYDMGDLLTPFTRKPDPNADYQEWCGLSHVIKDGQIIYKGMRYREGAYDGIDEVVADQRPRHYDGNYYDLTGRCMGTEVPTTPGIYIHNGNKICVSQMP